MNPTNGHREQAREIVTAHAQHSVVVRTEQLIETIARALSSHDTEVREVLESLAAWQLSGETHWCDARLPCTEQCQRIQVLYEKVQPKESSDGHRAGSLNTKTTLQSTLKVSP